MAAVARKRAAAATYIIILLFFLFLFFVLFFISLPFANRVNRNLHDHYKNITARRPIVDEYKSVFGLINGLLPWQVADASL